MPIDRRTVSSGDPLIIPADNYNAWNDAAAAHLEQQNRDATDHGLGGERVVLVKNTSESIVDRLGVLAVSLPIHVPPTGVEDEAVDLSFRDQVGFAGVIPTTEHRGQFVVLLESARPGEVVEAVMTGVTQAMIDVGSGNAARSSSELTDRAEIRDGETMLRLDSTGSAQILWLRSASGLVPRQERLALVRLNAQRERTFARIDSSADNADGVREYTATLRRPRDPTGGLGPGDAAPNFINATSPAKQITLYKPHAHERDASDFHGPIPDGTDGVPVTGPYRTEAGDEYWLTDHQWSRVEWMFGIVLGSPQPVSGLADDEHGWDYTVAVAIPQANDSYAIGSPPDSFQVTARNLDEPTRNPDPLPILTPVMVAAMRANDDSIAYRFYRRRDERVIRKRLGIITDASSVDGNGPTGEFLYSIDEAMIDATGDIVAKPDGAEWLNVPNIAEPHTWWDEHHVGDPKPIPNGTPVTVHEFRDENGAWVPLIDRAPEIIATFPATVTAADPVSEEGPSDAGFGAHKYTLRQMVVAEDGVWANMPDGLEVDGYNLDEPDPMLAIERRGLKQPVRIGTTVMVHVLRQSAGSDTVQYVFHSPPQTKIEFLAEITDHETAVWDGDFVHKFRYAMKEVRRIAPDVGAPPDWEDVPGGIVRTLADPVSQSLWNRYEEPKPSDYENACNGEEEPDLERKPIPVGTVVKVDVHLTNLETGDVTFTFGAPNAFCCASD